MVTVTAEQLAQSSTGRGRARGRGRLGAYIALTKPRIIELLLVTTAPTMFLAAGGVPDLLLLAGVLLGGALSAASANVFNCYLDRDIDRLMKRTENRPLVTGEVSPREALVFAWTLAAVSTAVLWAVANPLTAGLSVLAILLYVVFYTLLLKRRTEQNIVWGGVAGCMPVLIGWAGVTNSLGWEPFILFSVVFLWTPAHYWPLSVKYRDDYHAASVPMLSVTEGETSVSLQTVLYAWATVICSLLLVPVAPMGWVYTAVALGAGGWFVWESHVLYHRTISGENPRPMRVFHLSISYLTLLFVAVGVDPLVRLGG
ncbi:MAG: heme o synthase [Pseudoclavibacter sp.]|nr:heme o synthase [Pseudoclavibacter sp.]